MKKLFILPFCIAAVCIVACGRSAATSQYEEGDTLTSYSELLTLVDCGEYVVADVRNPWDTARLLHRYILIPAGSDIRPDIGGTVVKVPLRSSLVYSGVHAGAIKELGAIDAVTGVCDGTYYTIPEIVEGIRTGSIIDAGASMSPSVEKIVELSPDAILTSPYQNAGYGAVESLGIPIIECADYMEPTPLGRAEWIRLLGVLYGARDEAEAVFRQVEADYDSLSASVTGGSDGPVVIMEQLTDGVWYMPGGRSYQARMLQDAGARYLWAGDDSSGSLQLDFPTVYDRAHDADIWLVRTYGSDLTLDGLKSNYPLNSRFKAFADRQVYGCNTAVSNIFDETAFHPERLLREYISIFAGGDSLMYYRKAE